METIGLAGAKENKITMRFFSKFVFICNLCFIAAVILRLVERGRKINMEQGGPFKNVISFQPLESTLIILGYTAVLFNIIFVIIALPLWLAKKTIPAPKFLVWFNVILFIVQLYYFFFSTF